MVDQAFLDKTYAARDQFVGTLGEVSPDVIAPLINPAFMGGQAWPDLRQAWRIVRKGSHTIVISDGLSDPFSEEEEVTAGFGLEVLAESGDPMADTIQRTWLFDLNYQVSQQCADHGGVRNLIDDLGLISLKIPSSDVLGTMATEDDRVGVLLGVNPPDFKTVFDVPGGSVKVLTAKLLWPSEIEYAARGRDARNDLAKRFAADGTHHRSSMKRKPVV